MKRKPLEVLETERPAAPSETSPAAEPAAERVDLARSRIARNFYDQAHVRNRILKALLEIIDTMD